MTTDDNNLLAASAEAGEVESVSGLEEIPGQTALFPGLHGDEDGGQHLISPLSGKPLAVDPPMVLEKQPYDRDESAGPYLTYEPPPQFAEDVKNAPPELTDRFLLDGSAEPPRIKKERPRPYPQNPFIDRGVVPLASMREPGFLDRIEKINSAVTPVYEQPMADATTIKEAVSSKAAHADRTVAAALREAERYRPDAEYGFRVHKGEEPKYGEAGTPLIGFTYSCLMPDGSLAEGSVQIPTDHDGLTPHGQIKNYQTLASVIADVMTQLTVELNMRMNLARATRAAQEHECGQ